MTRYTIGAKGLCQSEGFEFLAQYVAAELVMDAVLVGIDVKGYGLEIAPPSLERPALSQSMPPWLRNSRAIASPSW